MRAFLGKNKHIVLVTGAIAILLILGAAAYSAAQAPGSELKRFSSMSELEEYLQGTSNWPSFYLFKDNTVYQATTAGAEAGGGRDYSTTNIQVAGVDEADIVKSDGDYLYVVSGSTIYILKAYPPEAAEVKSKIPLNNSYSLELYIAGDRLVVIGNGYSVVAFSDKMYPVSISNAFIRVYDITDRSAPALAREVTINGTISGSRMIGNYVYAVTQKWPYAYYSEGAKIELPSYTCNNATRVVSPADVYYVPMQDTYYSFMTVISVNVADDSIPPSDETFLAGASSTMYVSKENMYLVAQRSYIIRPMIMAPGMSVWRDETLIYRLSLKDGRVALEASGSLPGHVLNQYSMDEYGGYFRVATTEWGQNGSSNALYVMNMKMEIVGSLEGLAPGERIYSARFINERCYLVTFRQVDPFFVIDLSKPNSPEVLGYLKIPGYSSYLHPFDNDHIIGVGKEGNNLKLSLFNVQNVSAPKEVAKYSLNYSYSDSEALYDPKAFLFDASKSLLAMPVGWAEGSGMWRYSQGALVFNVSLEGGFVLRGVVVHYSDQPQSYWDYAIRRILYIEDALYTVSIDQVKISGLGTLDPISTIPLK